MVPLSEWIAGPGPDDARWIRVEEPSAAAGARGIALGLAERLDFPPARAEQLALAVTEAASNLVKHARVGTLLLRIGPAADGRGIELVTIDTGPGIADLPAALRDGTSTAGTLGIGLGAIGRIADFSDMYSVPGRGTTLAARFLPRPAPAGTHGHAGDQAAGLAGWAGLTRPISGEHECGDNYAVHWDGAVATAILSDGLGHGPLAAAASRAAIAAMRDGPADEPAALLERAHRQMSGTRGGAVAVVRVEPGWVSFAGLGNVAGWLTSGESRQGLVSVPGICGHQARRLRQFRYERPPGSVVILHSDGLTSRWNIRDLPGLVTRDPLVIAAALLSEAGVHRDDAGVLVLRP